MKSLYDRLLLRKKEGRKQLALLVDPDKTGPAACARLAESSVQCGVDYFFIGSSLLTHDALDACVKALKKSSGIPVILFPGNVRQYSPDADAILFLSLVSGRNPELLIGNHVLAAPFLKNSGLEILPTGYLLIDSGTPTSVSYMSHTTPIPSDKEEIAWCTALAAEMLGMKMIYLDAGSGGKQPVPSRMIAAVRSEISVPLIVGGGIRTPESAMEKCHAGADVIVVGNAIEKDFSLLSRLSEAVHSHQIS